MPVCTTLGNSMRTYRPVSDNPVRKQLRVLDRQCFVCGSIFSLWRQATTTTNIRNAHDAAVGTLRPTTPIIRLPKALMLCSTGYNACTWAKFDNQA